MLENWKIFLIFLKYYNLLIFLVNYIYHTTGVIIYKSKVLFTYTPVIPHNWEFFINIFLVPLSEKTVKKSMLSFS